MMKFLVLGFVLLVSGFAVGQGKVAYQSYVDGAVAGVRTTANEAKGVANALNAAVTGDDFVVVVTNYDSKTRLPAASFKFKEQDGSSKYRTIWNELDRWNWFFDHWVPTNLYTKAAQDARFAQKAWGQYASALGSDAPDDCLWVTQPVVLSCGLEWVPHTMESGGAIWVLTATGVTPSVTTNGYFKLCDESGNSVFEVVTGDKELAGAYCSGIETREQQSTPPIITLDYKVDTAPTIEATVHLGELTDWQDIPGAWVETTKTDTGYRAVITPPAGATQYYFFRGKYERGTEGYIRNTAPVKIEGGIITADGVKIRPVVSGSTVTWEVVK